MIPRTLATIVIGLVSIIWAANFILPFLVPSYKPDPTLNGVFMGLVGGALALSRGPSAHGVEEPEHIQPEHHVPHPRLRKPPVKKPAAPPTAKRRRPPGGGRQ